MNMQDLQSSLLHHAGCDINEFFFRADSNTGLSVFDRINLLMLAETLFCIDLGKYTWSPIGTVGKLVCTIWKEINKHD